MPRTLHLALMLLCCASSCGAFQSPLIMQGQVALRKHATRKVALTRKHAYTYRGTTQSAPKLDGLALAGRGIVEARKQSTDIQKLIASANLRARMWQIPLEKKVLFKPSAMNPATPTRVLGGLAIVFGVLAIARTVPTAGSVMANCVAGFVGGVATLIVSSSDENQIGNNLPEKIAAQGALKGVSCGSYSAFISLGSALSAGGLAGIALASLGTGVIMCLFHRAMVRASSLGSGGGVSLLDKMRTRASNGLFTENGLFGRSVGSGLVDWVVQYEAFFLSYAALVAACPWMGLTLAGTAVSGALAGVAASTGSALLKVATNLSSHARQCGDWLRGKKESLCGPSILKECSSTAVRNSVLFVAYRAAYDLLNCTI